MREVVAEAENPVMLYSIGKDSSVMLHLAREGVPSRRRRRSRSCTSTRRGSSRTCTRSATRMADEHELRPARARERGRARARHQPVRQRLGRPHRRDEDRGAQAGARQVRLRRCLRRRAPRRGALAREGAHLLVPLGAAPLGPEEPAARALAALQRAAPPRRVDPRLPALQLDGARRLAVHLPARRSRSCRSTSRRSGRSSSATGR